MTPVPADSSEALPPPNRRPLQIYALDPMRMEDTGAGFVTPRTVLSVPYEPLLPGPLGERIQVIDYDGARGVCYEPVNLDHPYLLLTAGLTPTETDPRFHQQMVYAVASSVWEAFEAAIGRRIGLRGGPLQIFPHAFYGDNAYYDPGMKALLFGYFQADDREAGPNLPGQMVFTCLSHDIVAHETAHAIVDRLRPGFNQVTNHDMLAFHEAFADLVAIFQHFKIEQVLVDAINEHKADLTSAEAISGLARQFGFASAQKAPLRSALSTVPDPAALRTTFEPHARGVILVQAVFDAYRTTYLTKVQDLLRLASGGSGVLQAGRPHPDLVNRLAGEASGTARLFFDRCVQAFTYLPPVDVTFGDFLRALVTVDAIASPDDDSFRTSIIEAFRRRGVFASEAESMADTAIAWRPRSTKEGLPAITSLLFTQTAQARGEFRKRSDEEKELNAQVASELEGWARRNAASLDLVEHSPDHPVAVQAFHATVRIDVNGQPWVDTVVQVTQQRRDLARAYPRLDGVVPTAGATVVADAVGTVRYIISKPLPAAGAGLAEDTSGHLGAALRLRQLQDMVEAFDRTNARGPYQPTPQNRLKLNLAQLHGGFDRELK